MATCGSCKERGQSIGHIKACYAGTAAVAVVDDNRAEYALAAAEAAAEREAWGEWDDNLREAWAEDMAIGNLRAAGFIVRRIA